MTTRFALLFASILLILSAVQELLKSTQSWWSMAAAVVFALIAIAEKNNG